MRSLRLACLLAMSMGVLGAFSTHASAASAPPAKAAASQRPSGLRFTIDGPALGGPVQFVVPGDHASLRSYRSDNMFNVTFQPQEGWLSKDGKHRLNMVMFGTEPAEQKEFTDASGVSVFSMAVVANVGTPQSQSVSMKFKPSKGERQPVRLAVERYVISGDNGGSAGAFTARLQRTNIKHNQQLYEVQGDFNVK